MGCGSPLSVVIVVSQLLVGAARLSTYVVSVGASSLRMLKLSCGARGCLWGPACQPLLFPQGWRLWRVPEADCQDRCGDGSLGTTVLTLMRCHGGRSGRRGASRLILFMNASLCSQAQVSLWLVNCVFRTCWNSMRRSLGRPPCFEGYLPRLGC